MFFVAGISSKIKPAGIAENCECPVCGRVSSLYIIYKYMTPHIFFIPTFHFHGEYVATCQNCTGVMELAPEKGAAFRKDNDTRIYREDLRVIKNTAPRTCANCGGEIYPGQAYCGFCGNPQGS